MFQRYIQHFPAAGEVVIFDRSWYNRAGVEHVMGFCTPEQYRRFLEHCSAIEKYFVGWWDHSHQVLDGGWPKKSNSARFEARNQGSPRQWKLSPMDLESFAAGMIIPAPETKCWKQTDTKQCTLYIVPPPMIRRKPG